MGVKVLNVAKSDIREKNAWLSVWQQNSVVESSLGKLNFFWQRNFLPHPLNSRNPLANELKLDLSPRFERKLLNSCGVTSVWPNASSAALIELYSRTTSSAKFRRKDGMLLTHLGLRLQKGFIIINEAFAVFFFSNFQNRKKILILN